MSVETAGSGFLADRRPKILFERHIFHNRTHGKFDAIAPGISNASAGGYGEVGGEQYERLERAMALDEQAALESASWGLAQIMRFNASAVGFSDVREMIEAFKDTEDQHIGAMATFIDHADLRQAIRSFNWLKFARGYNGTNFQKNSYDKKLALFHARYAVGPLPDLLVRAVQMALLFIGATGVGSVDGWFGEKTQKALLKFQQSQQLPLSGRPDDQTVALLIKAAGWS